MNKNIKIHFIGIGGIGMSAIAEIMHDLGYLIQGSDNKESENTQRLQKKGLKVFIGHKSENINSVSSVVYSSAIKKNNPEIIESKKNKIPLISRADMLAELMKNKKSIAIAGSHGKTTTTSLVGTILDEANFDPTIVNGGIINSYSKNNRYGKGEWMVVEADESDGSFLKLPHQISIITNLDIEHLDYYKNENKLFDAFELFIQNLPFYGTTIVCLDDKNLKKIIKKTHTRNIITYSIKNKLADVYIDQVKYEKPFTKFRININKKIFKYKGKYNYSIKAVGNHNVLNGCASIIASLLVGIKKEHIKKALKNYIGVKRRFSFLGKLNNALVYDDYAHHPTEIRATLLAAKQLRKKIIVIFQPHRYSRTQVLMKEFVEVLSKIKDLYLINTYSAGEKIVKKATSIVLFKQILKYQKNVKYIKNEDNLKDLLTKHTSKNSIILFMGAGSITKIAHRFMQKND
tara:strand:+ start:386 stop:1765 length:1380 start_codon:yes stop_codon:yes gene_type:complete